MWQLSRGRLPSREKIAKRKGPSNGLCALSGQVESTNHIFFECVLARFVWSGVRSMLGVQWQPLTFGDTFTLFNSYEGKTRKALWILFVVLCWALWTTRNKFCIEEVFPRQPAYVLFKSLIFLQQWRPVIKPKLLPLIDELARSLQATFAVMHTPVAAPNQAPA